VFRWLAVLAAVPAGCFVLYVFRGELSLQRLVEHEAAVRDFATARPVLTFLLAFLSYALATGASVPGAAGMSLAVAWLFGFWRALLLISFASTLGATLAFLVSRWLLRDKVRTRFAASLSEIEQALERDGAKYLFLLRLVPLIPFFVINIVMGLTPIRLRTYWWVSQLGMLPGTVLFVAAGSSVKPLKELLQEGVTGLLTWQVVAAFSALGLLPFIARRAVPGQRNKQRPHEPLATSGEVAAAGELHASEPTAV
jgi:uncharacterized membrane protein YdjX (TVP38/TMEM64 family)